MDTVRYLLAVALFCTGVYLAIDLLLSGFHWRVLLASLGCLLLAHFIKPERREHDAFSVLEIIDLLLDIPYRLIAVILRTAGRPFRGDIDGIDL